VAVETAFERLHSVDFGATLGDMRVIADNRLRSPGNWRSAAGPMGRGQGREEVSLDLVGSCKISFELILVS
jgi:hypothetical protein